MLGDLDAGFEAISEDRVFTNVMITAVAPENSIGFEDGNSTVSVADAGNIASASKFCTLFSVRETFITNTRSSRHRCRI